MLSEVLRHKYKFDLTFLSITAQLVNNLQNIFQ